MHTNAPRPIAQRSRWRVENRERMALRRLAQRGARCATSATVDAKTRRHARQTHHSLSRRQRRPRGQGRQLRRTCAMPAIRWRSRARYDGEGADELTFLDITASSDERDLILHVIEGVAEQVFIPLTVGGGVRTRRGRAPAAERGRRQGRRSTPRRCRTRNSSPRRAHATARNASSWRSTPGAAADGEPAGRSTPTADATRRASTRWRGRARGGAGRGGDPADQHGPRRHARGFDLELTRAVADAVPRPGDRLGRRRQPGAPRRRHRRGRRRRGAGRVDLSLRRTHGARGQGVHGRRQGNSQCATHERRRTGSTKSPSTSAASYRSSRRMPRPRAS